jgi:hypothetical protein
MCSPASFADGADRRDVSFAHVEGIRAEDLARGEVEEALEGVHGRERGLECVVGADQVHAHRANGALAHRVDAGDRGHVDEVRGALCDRAEEGGVHDVALVEGEVGMLHQLRLGESVTVEVVDRDNLVLIDKPPGERSSDETGAARHYDALSGERHDGESTFSDC